MNIYDISFKLFGSTAIKLQELFEPLETKLKISRMNIPLNKYSSFIILLGVATFIITFLLSLIFGSMVVGIGAIQFLVYLFLAAVISFGVSFFVYYYPNMIISERKSKIENSLSFVTIYLSTIAKSGFPPQEMFKLLARFKDYKTVSEEAKKINSDVQSLGVDVPTALSKAIERSPSPAWTELLAGLRNSITVGGETGKFLEEKAKGFIQKYKQRLEEFSNLLTLLMNLYITVVIVGVIFFVVISSLMATVGGTSIATIKLMQYGTVFIGLPILTAGFILMVKSSSPWGSS